MRKSVLAIFLIIILICTSAIAFSGCSLAAKIVGKTYVSYPVSDRFTNGNIEADTNFEDILIDWYGGSVYISQYDGDKFIVRETANQELDADMQLHWALFDATEYGRYYSIEYCKKGMWDLSTIKKDLLILIPTSMEKLNQLSITVRGECDIKIYLPDVSVIEDTGAADYNVHLDAEFGNIDAVFKDVGKFRMIGDGEKEANVRYRRLQAQKVQSIDYVASYAQMIFDISELTGYADIKSFAGNMYFRASNNIRSLKTDMTTGTTFISTKNFDSLDLKTREGLIGVEMHYLQKFRVTMSSYTDYGNNCPYKEPQFGGFLGFDEETGEVPENAIKNYGNIWTVLDGKNAKGTKIVDVKVTSGADVYFGSWQGVPLEAFYETGVLDLPNQYFPQVDEQGQIIQQQN